MKLYEEFREYSEMWGTLTEWVDSTGNKVQINKNTATPSSNTNTSSASNNNKLYVIFNYSRPNYLDDFCLLLAETDKTTTVNALIEKAEQSVENFGRYKKTLVCYKINPNDYDLDATDFIEAAEDKYYYGPDLHSEHRYVVYALSAMASDEKPLYELDRNIVEMEFYDEFLGQKINNTGITFDDIYDSNYSSTIISKVYNDPDFQKFMKDKLTKTITNAL